MQFKVWYLMCKGNRWALGWGSVGTHTLQWAKAWEDAAAKNKRISSTVNEKGDHEEQDHGVLQQSPGARPPAPIWTARSPGQATALQLRGCWGMLHPQRLMQHWSGAQREKTQVP